MVRLDLVSSQGNGLRYFPYSGHLGLTEILIEGTVQTRLDEDRKLLNAKNIAVAVRCYSIQVGPAGNVATSVLVDSTTELWRAKSHLFEPIGDSDHRFRIHIPPRINAISTVYFVQYRCIWRIEAVLNHQPIPGVGARMLKHSQLPFVSYHVPRPLPDDHHLLVELPVPNIQYQIQPPLVPIGPSDPVTVPISVHPHDPAVSLRAASLSVERRLHINGSHFTHPIVDTHSDGPFTRSDSGAYSAILSFQWPTSKSMNRWAIGETVVNQSDQVSVRFYTKIKVCFHSNVYSIFSSFPPPTQITLATPAGTETVDLEEKELLISSTNESERKLALATFNNKSVRARSKSKSPRRTKREKLGGTSPTSTVLPPVPVSAGSPPSQSQSHSTDLHSSASLASPSSPSTSTRRPHTSAGPRDRSHFNTLPRSGRNPSPPASPESAGTSTPAEPEATSNQSSPFRRWTSARAAAQAITGNSIFSRSPSASASIPSQSSSRSISTSTATSTVSLVDHEGGDRLGLGGGPGPPEDHIKEWELELEKIEATSSKNSAIHSKRLVPPI
jgi:hypothetical protein